MAKTPESDTAGKGDASFNAITQFQEAGFGNMVELSTAWFEALGDLSTEVVSFVVDRIKEDVKVQHEIMHCKNVAEVQQIQSQFLQKAMDQYQAETGKLIEVGSKAFAKKCDK